MKRKTTADKLWLAFWRAIMVWPIVISMTFMSAIILIGYIWGPEAVERFVSTIKGVFK